MIWLLTRLVVWPVKAVTGTTKVTTKGAAKATAGSFKAGYKTGRVLGYRRMVVLGAGVGIGLLIAPRTGRETRELVRSRLEERGLLSPPPPEDPPWVGPPRAETPRCPSPGNGRARATRGRGLPRSATRTLPEDPTRAASTFAGDRGPLVGPGPWPAACFAIALSDRFETIFTRLRAAVASARRRSTRPPEIRVALLLRRRNFVVVRTVGPHQERTIGIEAIKSLTPAQRSSSPSPPSWSRPWGGRPSRSPLPPARPPSCSGQAPGLGKTTTAAKLPAGSAAGRNPCWWVRPPAPRRCRALRVLGSRPGSGFASLRPLAVAKRASRPAARGRDVCISTPAAAWPSTPIYGQVRPSWSSKPTTRSCLRRLTGQTPWVWPSRFHETWPSTPSPHISTDARGGASLSVKE